VTVSDRPPLLHAASVSLRKLAFGEYAPLLKGVPFTELLKYIPPTLHFLYSGSHKNRNYGVGTRSFPPPLRLLGMHRAALTVESFDPNCAFIVTEVIEVVKSRDRWSFDYDCTFPVFGFFFQVRFFVLTRPLVQVLLVPPPTSPTIDEELISFLE